MLKIALFTNAYPYMRGEQFIEEELSCWSARNDVHVTLFPLYKDGNKRKVPENIDIGYELLECNIYEKVLSLIKVFISDKLYREIYSVAIRNRADIRLIYISIVNFYMINRVIFGLLRINKKYGVFDIAYCYWNDVQSYAVGSVKGKGFYKIVVSRVHGFDIYKDQRQYGYMPLKNQFVRYVDKYYVLSTKARQYFVDEYAVDKNKVIVSPLGVFVPNQLLHRDKSEKTFHVLSVSTCDRIKRIDKIIDALVILSKNNAINIFWTHIGAGIGYDEIVNYAKVHLCEVKSIQYDFKGYIDHSEVLEYLKSEKIDVFINSSESEGLPVSIMEAMSFGVPAIAPDIGGISDLITPKTGILMSANPSAIEIAHTLNKYIEICNSEKVIFDPYSHIKSNYNACMVYNDFIESLLSLSLQSHL